MLLFSALDYWVWKIIECSIDGNAYEYLIGQFASETGKKAGEFYTPQAVSKILTQIAISGQEDKRGLSVYEKAVA